MTERARNLLSEKINERVGGGELVSVVSDGGFNGEKYIMTAKLIISEEVGMDNAFWAEK